MKCPYRGEEMMRGYLMSSRDITFTIDNQTKVFHTKNRTIWN
ncbi:MAG: PF20097 family protein [Pilosibacter sp.]